MAGCMRGSRTRSFTTRQPNAKPLRGKFTTFDLPTSQNLNLLSILFLAKLKEILKDRPAQ